MNNGLGLSPQVSKPENPWVLVGAWGSQIMALGLVALVGREISRGLFHNQSGSSPEKLTIEDLIKKYGLWAVRTAEGICPVGDLECVAREAERLIRVRMKRI